MYIILTLALIFIFLDKSGIADKIIYKIRNRNDNDSSEYLPYTRTEYFFTITERNFYNKIVPIAEKMNTVIFSKVRLADLISVKEKSKDYYKHWNKIKSKHIDFVICDKNSYKPLFVLELDDKSHEKENRIERDKFVDNALSNAKVPIFHIKVSNSYNEDYINEIFKTFTNKDIKKYTSDITAEQVNTL